MKHHLINLLWRWTEFRNSFRPLTPSFNDPHRYYGEGRK